MASREIELIKAGYTYRFTEVTRQRADHRIIQLVKTGDKFTEVVTIKTVDGYSVYTKNSKA